MDDPRMVERHGPGRILWSALVLPGVAWLVHFLGIWAIAEYGCVAKGFPRGAFLGVMDLAWVVLVWSVILLGVVVYLGMLSSRVRRHLKAMATSEVRDSDLFMARAGIYSAFLFGFIIAVQTIPIFYYLERC